MYARSQFLNRIGQTSEIPQAFEISKASSCFLIDQKGNTYVDMISGFSVSNIGHQHPKVIEAIKNQADLYLHSTVYGEHIQSPQIKLAELLTSCLPPTLNQVYFLTTGSETIDAAIKLCRKATGRFEIVVCRKAYHGSTLAAESLRSDHDHNQAFRPLIPGIRFIDANKISDLEFINSKTAGVITEVVQAEAGVVQLEDSYLNELRIKCNKTGSLLIFDEIQTGLGRTGSLFAFQKTSVCPDILLSGKALGGGMPLAALITSKQLLVHFMRQPALSYISTFGGHPVSCAAGHASLKVLFEEKILEEVELRKELMIKILSAPTIFEIRCAGLLMAIDFKNESLVWTLINRLYHKNILVESFLFCPGALRIAPPLNIPIPILEKTCQTILETIIELNT